MFKRYYDLAKPGIIYGNCITALAGFFLASKGAINWILMIAMLLGLSFVIGGGCVFNSYFDRDIDAKMERTKKRATVVGDISTRNILIYGFFLVVIGFLILYFYTNILTMVVASVGVIFYLAIYTPLKRKTVFSTLIGSVAGAVPPVVGYCAVTNTFNLEALLLFFILISWQLPHFYSIALRKKEDYSAAGIPVLSVVYGNKTTKIHIFFHVVIFVVVSLLLTVFGFTGIIYLVIMLIISIIWFIMALQGFRLKTQSEDIIWARNFFFFSLIVLMVFSVVVSLGLK